MSTGQHPRRRETERQADKRNGLIEERRRRAGEAPALVNRRERRAILRNLPKEIRDQLRG